MNGSVEKRKVSTHKTHKKCWARDCGHRTDSHDCVFSTFPRNPERCKEWSKAVGVKDFVGLPIIKLSTLRFICSCHFKTDDYRLIKNGKRLLEHAIPSVFTENTIPLNELDLTKFAPTVSTVISTCRVQVPIETIKQSNQYSFHNMFNGLKTVLPIGSVNDVSLKQEKQLSLKESITGDNSTASMKTLSNELCLISESRGLSLPSFNSDNCVQGKSRKISYSTTDVENIQSPPSAEKKRFIRCSGAVDRTTHKLIMDQVGLKGENVSPKKKILLTAIQKERRTVEQLKTKIFHLEELINRIQCSTSSGVSSTMNNIEPPALQQIIQMEHNNGKKNHKAIDIP
ncbi:uncharacterized protein LOC123262208 isoform X1 [Cotesia glomerata]|uniref:uncharacterized protein LOC123262208 isoform X1 n=1 Tax=Cotesia glomerata TaxID=32391 RepID=UPI001D00D89D|nr:uncharacterized protein LOC123262208 isoform X1 [Cotesia glomerata]